jgi:hypothetical protein
MVVTNSGGRVDEVVRRVDAEPKACFHEDPNGDLRPWVCISCDGFVKKEKKRVITVKRLKEEKELFKPQRKLPKDVKSHHQQVVAQKSLKVFAFAPVAMLAHRNKRHHCEQQQMDSRSAPVQKNLRC